MVKVRLFIQARSSSDRLPNKVLLPVRGKPLIIYLINEIKKVCKKEDLYVLTSEASSDDELCEELEKNGVNFYRGNLGNVYQRYCGLLEQIDCDYFYRICADSPFLPINLITLYNKLIESNPGIDIISNVIRRTFPKGFSLELVKKTVFISKNFQKSNDFSYEHVTGSFYGVEAGYSSISLETCQEFRKNYAIDTLEDYNQLKEGKGIERLNQTDFRIINSYDS